jgi:hypothetical protein
VVPVRAVRPITARRTQKREARRRSGRLRSVNDVRIMKMLIAVQNASNSPQVSLSMLVVGHDESSFSESGSSDECAAARPNPVPKKRRQKVQRKQEGDNGAPAVVAKKAGKTTNERKKNPTVLGSHTVNSVLATWDETSEYGKAFREMAVEDQTKEVLLLNKGSEG